MFPELSLNVLYEGVQSTLLIKRCNKKKVLIFYLTKLRYIGLNTDTYNINSYMNITWNGNSYFYVHSITKTLIARPDNRITVQGLFQQFIVCDNRTQSTFFFQNIFKFYTFLPKFSNILPALIFFCPFSEKSHAGPYFLEQPCSIIMYPHFF